MDGTLDYQMANRQFTLGGGNTQAVLEQIEEALIAQGRPQQGLVMARQHPTPGLRLMLGEPDQAIDQRFADSMTGLEVVLIAQFSLVASLPSCEFLQDQWRAYQECLIPDFSFLMPQVH